MIRILIVEDRPEVSLGLQMLLSSEPDMHVVGWACNCPAALESAMQLAPDVILVDVELPRQNGIETAAQLSEQHAQTPVVVFTIQDDRLTRARARHARVAGFVTKEKPVETLLATIREVVGRPSTAPNST